MPRRTRSDKKRRTKLTWPEELDLVIGPDRVPVFANDEERRAAWEMHRERLMTIPPPGRRPEGYWDFEGPPELREPPRTRVPGLEHRRIAWLRERGLLSEAEDRYLRERNRLEADSGTNED